MKYLLFGGAQNVGKSETIWRTAQYLINAKSFSIVAGTLPSGPLSLSNPFWDFKVVLEGIDKHGNPIKVLFVSATDTYSIIDWAKDFWDQLPFTVDIVVSSIRDDFDPSPYSLRQYFFDKFGVHQSGNFFIEIPLAKITRRNFFTNSLKWYQNSLDSLSIHLLANQPYNI